ncbi:MAG: Gfo/Idh/MocA family protein [Gemmatimonadales bacterium]
MKSSGTLLVRKTVPTDRRIRIALIGCGRISANHFEAIEAHRDSAELIGVADTDPAALQQAIARTGAPGFPSLDALLANSDPDIVVLATPSGLHARQAIQVADTGRHVMSEKPMATKLDDGRAMLRATDAAGVHLFIVKQNRTNPTLQLLKRAIEAGRFGRIFLVTVNVFWQRPQSYYDSASWRGTWEFDGGAFMNQASHYVDMLDWLVGPVASVQAYAATLARRIEVEDTGVLALQWRSGALGSLNVTMLTYPRNLEGSITVLGETGTVRVGGIAVNRIDHWQFAEPDPMDAEVERASYETTSVYGRGHLRYYRNVIEALRGLAPPDTDGREGLRSLELLAATYLSAREGRRIALPLPD